MSEFYETQKDLQRLTETNLKKEFTNVHDYCESAIHHANRCNLVLSIKHVVMAELSTSVLISAAQQRYINGTITKDELTNIIDKSMDLIGDQFPEEVTKAMIVACDCRKA